MCVLTTNWNKNWMMGALLTGILFVSGRTIAAEPFMPGAFSESNALLGMWKTLEIDEHGAFQLLVLSLRKDGQFKLVIGDAKGKTEEPVIGRYTYTSGVLKLTVEKRTFAEMDVKFSDDALDLSVGKKSTHWVKDRP